MVLIIIFDTIIQALYIFLTFIKFINDSFINFDETSYTKFQ
jgi:hypothetical protein